MKKLTMCAAAVTVVLSSQVSAAPGDVQLVGFVSPVCEVSGLFTQLLDFGSVVSSGQSVSTNIGLQCNDVDGATVTMTSAEGGLESDDDEDFALTYDATFAPGGGLSSFTLSAPGGPGLNNVSADHSYGGSSTLAAGTTGTLSVVTTEGSPWAGGYSDTLTVNITSN